MTQFSTRLYVNWQFLCSSPLVLFIRCCSPPRGLLHQKYNKVHKLLYEGGELHTSQAAWGMCYWEAASDHCRTFFILKQIIKHIRGPLALMYQCWWVADLTELLKCCRHADSMKCKSPEKLQPDWCMSICTNCCLSSTSQEDRKCFEAISITGGMQNLIWFTSGMYSEYVLCPVSCGCALWVGCAT